MQKTRIPKFYRPFESGRSFWLTKTTSKAGGSKEGSADEQKNSYDIMQAGLTNRKQKDIGDQYENRHKQYITHNQELQESQSGCP